MITVGLVDDHALIRLGTRELLASQFDMRVVGEAGNGREALELVRRETIDVLLLDVSMPDLSGVDAIPHLRAQAPEMAILILSAYPEEQFALKLMRQGARGFLNKLGPPGEVVRAIRQVARGGRYVSARVAELLAQELDHPGAGPLHQQLSARELQVFLKLAAGATVSEVAAALTLSSKTVSTYRARVLEKLNLQTNSDLTYYALKNHLIE